MARQLRPRGFSLLELLVVIGIILVLLGIVLPVLLKANTDTKIAAAKHQMDSINNAMELYRFHYNYFPPDNTFGAGSSNPQAGSQALAYYLTTRFAWGESHCGAHIDVPSSRLAGNPPTLVSPLKNHMYLYANIYDADGISRSYLVVDPGPDGKFGGTINTHPANGAWPFQPDGTGNDKDNIYSTVIR